MQINCCEICVNLLGTGIKLEFHFYNKMGFYLENIGGE